MKDTVYIKSITFGHEVRTYEMLPKWKPYQNLGIGTMTTKTVLTLCLDVKTGHNTELDISFAHPSSKDTIKPAI